jgi:uncharacterized membrane protein
MELGEVHHHHHHGAWPEDVDRPGALPVTRVLTGVAVAALVVALVGMVVWWPRGDSEVDQDALGFADRVDGTVTAATDGPCSFDPETICHVVDVEVEAADGTTDTARLEADLVAAGTPVTKLDAGDEVVLNDAGPDAPAESRYAFADIRRSRSLALLAIVFAVVVVALGRLRGLLALAGIGVTFAVLLGFLFPALLQGAPPVGAALTATTIVAFGTLYLAHGLNHATTVALLGTLASLALTAALAVTFARAATLSGLADEDSLALLTAAPDLDFRGLLLAAVIVGALGVLDDVTVTQVSAVAELRRSDPTMPRRQLFQAGIRIGRDHIASTVNTLVLAYSAAALPLLLIYSQSGLGLGGVLASETVAVEIVQTLVGSIGLVASVPLTTGLAAWALSHTSGGKEAGEGAGGHRADAPWEREEPVPVPAARPARRRPRPAEEPTPWYPPSLAGWPPRQPGQPDDPRRAPHPQGPPPSWPPPPPRRTR